MNNGTTWNGSPHTGERSKELPTHLDALRDECSCIDHDVDYLAEALGYDLSYGAMGGGDWKGWMRCQEDPDEAKRIIHQMRHRIRHIEAFLLELGR